MNEHTFTVGLHMIAEAVYSSLLAFDRLRIEVLEPLCGRLKDVSERDVAQCVIALGEPTMWQLFAAADDGLRKLFNIYARGSDGLTAESFAKFSNDFDITQDLAHTALQRIYSDCVHIEVSSGNELQMTFFAFQLALIMIAVRTSKDYDTSFSSIDQKVCALFRRLNAVALSNGIHAHGLLPTGRVSQITGATDYAPERVRESAREGRQSLTWAQLMVQEAT